MNLAIKINNISKQLKNQILLDNVSFSVSKGEIYALYGQSEIAINMLFRIIMGLAKPNAGSVELFGKPLDVYKNSHYERIGSVLYMESTHPQLTIYEELDIHRRLMGVKDKKSVDVAIELTGLKEVMRRETKFLTAAIKQKVLIAKAILHHPELLLLNNPFNGLDYTDKKEMTKVLTTVWKKSQTTIVFSTGIFDEVKGLFHKIGVIKNGCLVEEFNQQEIVENSKKHIRLVVDNPSMSCSILEIKCGIDNYRVIDKETILVYKCESKSAEINRVLVENGISVKEVQVVSHLFEENYFSL